MKYTHTNFMDFNKSSYQYHDYLPVRTFVRLRHWCHVVVFVLVLTSPAMFTFFSVCILSELSRNLFHQKQWIKDTTSSWRPAIVLVRSRSPTMSSLREISYLQVRLQPKTLEWSSFLKNAAGLKKNPSTLQFNGTGLTTSG